MELRTAQGNKQLDWRQGREPRCDNRATTGLSRKRRAKCELLISCQAKNSLSGSRHPQNLSVSFPDVACVSWVTLLTSTYRLQTRQARLAKFSWGFAQHKARRIIKKTAVVNNRTKPLFRYSFVLPLSFFPLQLMNTTGIIVFEFYMGIHVRFLFQW